MLCQSHTNDAMGMTINVMLCVSSATWGYVVESACPLIRTNGTRRWTHSVKRRIHGQTSRTLSGAKSAVNTGIAMGSSSNGLRLPRSEKAGTGGGTSRGGGLESFSMQVLGVRS